MQNPPYLPLFLLAAISAALTASAVARAEERPFYGDSPKALTGNLRTAPLIKQLPAGLKKMLPKDVHVYSIDLNSDGKPDFITRSHNTLRTCFYDSNFKKRSCEKRGYGDGFVYYYFAQLDDDPMLELFDFTGDEDSSDYKLRKLDPKTWKTQVITKIHPLIHPVDQAHKGLFWGYPWDITDLPLKRVEGKITFGSLKTLESGEEDAPAIFFEGVPTQGDPSGTKNEELSNEKWVTLKEFSALRKPAK